MLFLQNSKVLRLIRWWRLRRIAAQVRAGDVPKDIDFKTVCEALRTTRPRGAVELFGFLFAKVYDKNGVLKEDHGLVGVREVTNEFVDLLVDGMCASDAAGIGNFNAHEMGDGSTAETDTETELVNAIDGRNIGTQTHGATSNIYRSVATIVAGQAYTVIEHAIFDTSDTDEVMLDRTKLGSEFTVATDDEVEWTYELTVNVGG